VLAFVFVETSITEAPIKHKNRTEQNMKRTDAFPPKFVNVSMLEDLGGVFTGIIRGVMQEEIQNPSGPTERKSVVYLTGLQQGLILNGTNWDTLEELSGEADSDAWEGLNVTLFVDHKVPFGSKTVSGVRIRDASDTGMEPIGNVAERVLEEAQ